MTTPCKCSSCVILAVSYALVLDKRQQLTKVEVLLGLFLHLEDELSANAVAFEELKGLLKLAERKDLLDFGMKRSFVCESLGGLQVILDTNPTVCIKHQRGGGGNGTACDVRMLTS